MKPHDIAPDARYCCVTVC